MSHLSQLKPSSPRVAQATWAGRCDDVAIIACTSKGSVESWIETSAPKLGDGFGLSDLSTVIARHIGADFGPRLTLSAACAGGLHGLIRGAMMIQTGEATRVLVVAAEASVHPLFLNSFQRLGVLSAEGELCRPFDQNRSGFLMSDAAAAICLEAGPVPHSIATVKRFAMGGDATHLTGSDPDAKVLRHLLKEVIGEDPIDLFHAHGTGTISNDETEIAALTPRCLRVPSPISSATKPCWVTASALRGWSRSSSTVCAIGTKRCRRIRTQCVRLAWERFNFLRLLSIGESNDRSFTQLGLGVRWRRSHCRHNQHKPALNGLPRSIKTITSKSDEICRGNFRYSFDC